MLRASFPSIQCPNGHIHSYNESECPKCHEPREDTKLTTTNFCECGMVRPQVIETGTGKMIVHPSKFCFMCGKYFEDTTNQELFNY